MVTRGHSSGESGEILDKWHKAAVMQGKQVRITKHRPDNCPQYCTEHWNHAESRVQMPSSHIIIVIRGDTLVGLTTVIISLGICIPSHIIHLNYTQFLLKINKWNFSIARGTLLNTLLWPIWEKNLTKSRYRYVYNRFASLYT